MNAILENLASLCAELTTLKQRRDRWILNAAKTETHKDISAVTCLSVSRIKAIVMEQRKLGG